MRNDHSRSLKVICYCANRRGIYDLLSALNSNLTSIFNRSWDITSSLHIHTPPVLEVELEKDGWEKVDMVWCQGVQNIALSNHRLKSVLKCTVWSQCMPIPDRRTDEHHGNSTTIHSNTSHANKSVCETDQILEFPSLLILCCVYDIECWGLQLSNLCFSLYIFARVSPSRLSMLTTSKSTKPVYAVIPCKVHVYVNY